MSVLIVGGGMTGATLA
ncbi:hypothetical protein F869_21139, partial [Klebsiella pneumoniae subsp. pneumoniae CIP 52.145 = B5055]